MEEEIISTGTGRATLHLGTEIVILEWSDEGIKEEKGDLLVIRKRTARALGGA